jgi:hypothetical protein
MDKERAALLDLVRAAGGRATIEPVTMLGLALLSPWAGDRRDFLDRPNRIAPQTHAAALTEFLAEVGPLLSTRRLPTDAGYLAWLHYMRLAVPVVSLDRVPRWVAELADAQPEAWIALPPTRGYRNQIEADVIEVDGRVAALHLLVAQAANSSDPTNVPRDAVTTILEWFLGPHAAHWSSAASDQCAAMRFSMQNAGQKAWYSTWTSVPVEPVREVITRAVPIVPETWRVPPPTPAEVAAEQERQRIIAEGEASLKAWNERGRRVPTH